ncbi:MAG TPA: ribosome silencing factor [Bacillota bacterium]|nr:ribosome silencing factor [Bacillota bacterium]
MILLHVNTDIRPSDLPSLPHAMLAVSVALEKKAEDVVLLDISSVSIMADFFMICTVRTDTHARAVRDSVTQALERAGLNLRRREGSDASGWVLLDWGDIIVHIFGPAEREFYSLEKLWGDARVCCYDTEAPSVEHRPAE